jgi:hypothetical protein
LSRALVPDGFWPLLERDGQIQASGFKSRQDAEKALLDTWLKLWAERGPLSFEVPTAWEAL